MRAWPRLSVLSVRPQGVSVPSVFPQRVLIQIDIIFGQMEIVKTL